MWIKMSEKKPTIGLRNIEDPLIVTFRGYSGGQCFETFSRWDHGNLDICNPDGKGKISHWWNGKYDMDLATKVWFENEDKKEKEEIGNAF